MIDEDVNTPDDTDTRQPGDTSLWALRRLRRNPFRFLEDVASRGDVAPFELPGRQGFLINHPDLIEQVLVRSPDSFIKAPALQRATRLLGRGLLTSEAPIHAARRRVIQPAFHRQRLEAYADVMVRRSLALATTWRGSAAIDVSEQMSHLTLGIVGETLFSADLMARADELRRIVAEAVTTLDPLVSLVAPRRRLRPARRRLEEIVETLIAERLASADRPGDLLDMLLDGDDDAASGRLSAQLLDDAITMLLAGFDTITNALTWTWVFLAEHPAAAADLYAELDEVLAERAPTFADIPRLVRTRAVLAESLRVRPPAWIIARQTTRPVQVADTVMPAGSLVVVSPYLVHRDSRFYAAPHTFDPSRWSGDEAVQRPKLAYLPFGAGRRSCVGESFAWMEGVLVLATLARAWRLESAGGRAAEIDPRITLRPRGPVMMIPHPRA
jgi:cytochrome P450